ncbi:MAG: FecR family protein [Sphingobacterium composti]|uniref:FecR family protein n=1 Tax=Sphingobacterium composti TaxID=363260 RepID=UPI0013597C1D|nr:FecR family protein [Sphingobacterium composti Ten et al. 2007 non Yoo et al. 2007]
MKSELFNKLLEKYKNNTATEAERKVIDDWFENLSSSESSNNWSDTEINKLYNSIRPKSQIRRLRYWLSAAVAILIASVGLYYYGKESVTLSYEIALENVLPNNEAPKIILENGEVIYLDDQKDGLTIGDNGIQYDDGTNVHESQTEIITLTIQIPRGKKYKVELSDGTKVWLNAATTLKYPSRFAKDKRELELEGEAFFEVAPLFVQENGVQIRVPFEVKTSNQVIKVLGTHFNVSSYGNVVDERTTLVEGSVQLINNVGQSKVLKPGQQGVISSTNQNIMLRNADVELVTAWKNDLFIFRNASFKEIMQELERWYDIKIDIDKYPDTKFYGELNRNVPLSDVLALIQLTSDIKFKLVSNGNVNRLIID